MSDLDILRDHLREEFGRAIAEAKDHLDHALTPMHVFTRTVLLEALQAEYARLMEDEAGDLDDWLLEQCEKLGSPLGSQTQKP